MNYGRRNAAAAVLATLTVLGGCASLPENIIKTPEVELRNVEVMGLGFKSQTFLLSFDIRNPNKVYALIRSFAANQVRFHGADGTGYAFVADQILALDALNPQTAARLTSAFESWRRFDENRQALMLHQLQRLADLPELSKDSAEMVGRILDARG